MDSQETRSQQESERRASIRKRAADARLRRAIREAFVRHGTAEPAQDPETVQPPVSLHIVKEDSP